MNGLTVPVTGVWVLDHDLDATQVSPSESHCFAISIATFIHL